MFYKSFLISLGLLTLANCNAQKDSKTSSSKNSKIEKSTVKEGEIIYFTEGENKLLKDFGMNVTFKQIVEDSRCPKDVQCVWAGVAIAEIEVMGLATKPVTLQLANIDNAARNYSKTKHFNGYTISLERVSDSKTEGTYKIGLIIKKDSGKTTTK